MDNNVVSVHTTQYIPDCWKPSHVLKVFSIAAERENALTIMSFLPIPHNTFISCPNNVGDRHLQCISFIAAPSKTRHLTVTRIFTDGFEINWITPQQLNGSALYELNYGTNTTVFSTVDTASDDTYYNLTGLQQNTPYYIRVVAVNYVTLSGPVRTEGEWITAATLAIHVNGKNMTKSR